MLVATSTRSFVRLVHHLSLVGALGALATGCESGGGSTPGDTDGGAGAGGEGGAGGGGGDGGSIPIGEVTLAPGAAGTGRLAYTVVFDEGPQRLQVLDLDSSTVIYRQPENRGEIEQFWLSPDGRHLLSRGQPIDETALARGLYCDLVDLSDGSTTDCRLSEEYLLSFAIGMSADGTRVAFSALQTGTGELAHIVWENGVLTTAPPAPPGSGSPAVASGALSPDGETIYGLRYRDTSEGGGIAVWKYPLAGPAAQIVELPEGVHASVDSVHFQISEDGQHLLFQCIDEAQQGLNGVSACAVDLFDNRLTLYSTVWPAGMSLDGQSLTGVILGQTGFHVFDFGSTTPRTTVPVDGAWPGLSPDSSRLAWRLVDGGQEGLWYSPHTTNLNGSSSVLLSGNGGSAPRNGRMAWSR